MCAHTKAHVSTSANKPASSFAAGVPREVGSICILGSVSPPRAKHARTRTHRGEQLFAFPALIRRRGRGVAAHSRCGRPRGDGNNYGKSATAVRPCAVPRLKLHMCMSVCVCVQRIQFNAQTFANEMQIAIRVEIIYSSIYVSPKAVVIIIKTLNVLIH